MVWSAGVILILRFVTDGDLAPFGLVRERVGYAFWPLRLAFWGWIVVAGLVVVERLIEAGIMYKRGISIDGPVLVDEAGDASENFHERSDRVQEERKRSVSAS